MNADYYKAWTTEELRAEIDKQLLFVNGKIKNATKWHKDNARQCLNGMTAQLVLRGVVTDRG